MKTWLVPVLGIVAVGLAATALATPWWSVQIEGTFFHWPYSDTMQFDPFQWTLQSATHGPGPNETTIQSRDYALQPELGTAFRVGLVPAVAGTACGAAMLALVAAPRLRPSMRRGAPVLSILGSLFLAAAALYLMLQIPGAANADLFPVSIFQPAATPVVTGFWGTGYVSGPHSGATVTYGAGWAWYALVAAAGLLLADAALLIHRQRIHPWAALRQDT